MTKTATPTKPEADKQASKPEDKKTAKRESLADRMNFPIGLTDEDLKQAQ